MAVTMKLKYIDELSGGRKRFRRRYDLLRPLCWEHADDAKTVDIGVGALVKILMVNKARFRKRIDDTVEKLKLISGQALRGIINLKSHRVDQANRLMQQSP